MVVLLYVEIQNVDENITINSFYEKFSKQKLSLISEIIKCFIVYDYNLNNAYKYITEEKNTFVSKHII